MGSSALPTVRVGGHKTCRKIYHLLTACYLQARLWVIYITNFILITAPLQMREEEHCGSCNLLAVPRLLRSRL